MQTNDEIIRSVIGDNNNIVTCEGYAVEIDEKYETISKSQSYLIDKMIKEAEKKKEPNTYDHLHVRSKQFQKQIDMHHEQIAFLEEQISGIKSFLDTTK